MKFTSDPSHMYHDQFTYVQDEQNVIHLADESPLGGLVSGCGLVGNVRVVEPMPAGYVCNECRADADEIEATR